MTADKKRRKKPKEKPPIIITTPPDKVYEYVSSADNPPTTSEIAKGTGIDSKKVYRICQSFNKKGEFEKHKKPSVKPRYFSSILGQTMHSGNYELIKKLNKELPEIIQKYELKDPRMDTNLRKFFKKILREYPYYHNSIVSAMEKLTNMIKRAKTIDDVISSLGMKQYHQQVCTWKPLKR